MATGSASADARPQVASHKLVLLGDTNVGKSCLVVRFARGEYFDYQVRRGMNEALPSNAAGSARPACCARVPGPARAERTPPLSRPSPLPAARLAPPQEPTIGAAFLTQTVALGEGGPPADARVIRFELWDTAGQERYRACLARGAICAAARRPPPRHLSPPLYARRLASAHVLPRRQRGGGRLRRDLA